MWKKKSSGMQGFGKDGTGRVLGFGSGVSKTTLMAATPYKRKDDKVERSKLELQSQMDDLKRKAIHTGVDLESAIDTCLGYSAIGNDFMKGVRVNPVGALPSRLQVYIVKVND
ncbi:hypothetical protein IFM89_008463 [Coptis chinensis]|uniref:Uncharacterized protein n=1 Tax=Coptis chinensis TaxID=261450 RepID=A0A835H577_9MAGN|nr:hypothetical protein IFM89_008463 [Coptis chinensis]